MKITATLLIVGPHREFMTTILERHNCEVKHTNSHRGFWDYSEVSYNGSRIGMIYPVRVMQDLRLELSPLVIPPTVLMSLMETFNQVSAEVDRDAPNFEDQGLTSG